MLHSETFGQGPDLVFLHGLFGAGDNWRSIGRKLSDQFRIHLLDLPNHGKSDWIDDPSLERLSDIVSLWIQTQGISHYYLLGHSMGGKVAMQMALNKSSNEIEKLIIVDIAPKHYPPHHQDVFAAVKQVAEANVTDRKSAERIMIPFVSDDGVRQFLLKSLFKNGEYLAWRFNAEILQEKYDAVASAPQALKPFSKPTLFIKGMNSQYITGDDQTSIMKLFPAARAKLIEGAGHWPHAEKPVVFSKILNDFLTEQ